MSREHGSPADRGRADAYYGRSPDPHKYPAGTYHGQRIRLTDKKEIAEYMGAYYSETDRKVYD